MRCVFEEAAVFVEQSKRLGATFARSGFATTWPIGDAIQSEDFEQFGD